MAVENCVQLSTSASVRSSIASNSQLHIPLLKQKYNLSAIRVLKTSFPSLTSSFSTSVSHRKSHNSISIVCSASKAASEVQPVTDSNWESLVIQSQKTVLVEFWAPWCGPCKMIAPVIDELAKEYSGKIECFKLNTDECPNIATQYNIRSIPTVLFFKNGERKESIIGAVPKSTLEDSIDKYLGA